MVNNVGMSDKKVEDLWAHLHWLTVLAQQGNEVTAAMADYVWYTPVTQAPDYCAQMRKQFGK